MWMRYYADLNPNYDKKNRKRYAMFERKDGEVVCLGFHHHSFTYMTLHGAEIHAKKLNAMAQGTGVA